MKSNAATVDEYISELPEERKEVIRKLRTIILQNVPNGIIENMSYGMIGYVVSFDKYPKGYHCKPKKELPFINLASQKKNISFYHMGLYENATLLEWFKKEYTKHSKYKLDMGKCCVRFKRMNDIPYELIGQLLQKLNLDDYISDYERIIHATKR